MTKVTLKSGKTIETEDAAGVKGIIIRSESSYFFRVYRKDQQFTDYVIKHDDLAVTIDQDALASFYSDGEKNWIDHNPSVLGLKKTSSNEGTN